MSKVQRINFYNIMAKGSSQQKKEYMAEMVRQRWNWNNPTLKIRSTASAQVQETIRETFLMERILKSMKLR